MYRPAEDKGAGDPLDLTSFNLLKDKLGDVLCSLNERERQVLELAARGTSLKFIAAELGVAATTVSETLRGARSRQGTRRKPRMGPRPQ